MTAMLGTTTTPGKSAASGGHRASDQVSITPAGAAQIRDRYLAKRPRCVPPQPGTHGGLGIGFKSWRK